MESWNIKGHNLEYIDETHTYLCDGIILPSITQILKIKFGEKYLGISEEILNRASFRGTAVHKAIETFEKENKDLEIKDYDKYGNEEFNSLVELNNYKFLKKLYKFECLDNEVPIILFIDDTPIACGRLDLVLKFDNVICLGDIKRTSTLDKLYLAYQLNLYRIGYQQCYGVNINALKGIHLRDEVRKVVNIPINEELAVEIILEYLERY